jgi:phosphopantetheinyl transferase
MASHTLQDNGSRAKVEVRFAWIHSMAPADIEQITLGLSVGLRTRISRYRTEDRRRQTIIGRLLLADALRSLGLRNVTTSVFDEDALGRPALPACYGGSISHAGELVVVGASTGCTIGVDVERADLTPHYTISRLLPNSDWNVWRDDPFSRIWTAKEAIAKAANASIDEILSIPLGKQATFVNGKRWFTTFLNPANNYLAAIACDQDLRTISVKELGASALLNGGS